MPELGSIGWSWTSTPMPWAWPPTLSSELSKSDGAW